MNPPVPPGPDPDPDPPGPGPDPPEPTTYELNCTCTYSTDYGNVPLRFTMYYKATSDAAWVQCDTHMFYSGTRSGSSSDLITLDSIPAGCHSVKVDIESLSSEYIASMKHPNDATTDTSLTWGSGNDGWNQDVDTDIVIGLTWLD